MRNVMIGVCSAVAVAAIVECAHAGGNDNYQFIGSLQQVTDTLVNPYSGESVDIDAAYFVNTGSYLELPDAGIDTLWGTSGADYLLFRNGMSNPVISNVERIEGGDGNDVFVLADILIAYVDAKIFGGLGDDLIWSNSGDDDLFGEAGVDTIHGGPGEDRINGGSEGDRLAGGDGDDFIDGGTGSDIIWGDDGDDNLRGRGDSDTIFGGDGNDTMRGDDGDDELVGGDGRNIFFGGDGEDVIFSTGEREFIFGDDSSGDWSDTIHMQRPVSEITPGGVSTIFGVDAGDVIDLSSLSPAVNGYWTLLQDGDRLLIFTDYLIAPQRVCVVALDSFFTAPAGTIRINTAAGIVDLDAASIVPSMPPACPADFNSDAVVDASDLAILLAGWGSSSVTDVDYSCITDAGDLAVLLAAWGGCPAE